MTGNRPEGVREGNMVRCPPRKGRRGVRYLTPRRYLATCEMVSVRMRGGGPACCHGHYDCAAWEGGPCSEEVRIWLGDE